jgi:hypothetical protein
MAITRDPDPVSEVSPQPVSPRLADIVMRLLSRDPAGRPVSARVLQSELDALDDIGVWTEDDARRWWLEHKGQVDRSRGALLDDLGRVVR